MKNLITLLSLTLLVAFSCENKPDAKYLELADAEKQLDTNLTLYKTVWDKIINDRQIDLINETNFDSNITAISLPENIVGIDAFKEYYNNYLTGFPEAEFTIIDAFGQGDKIVKHWHFKGTHNGDFFGIPASGRSLDIAGTTLVKMKDGKIAQEQDFMDKLDFYQQLGLLPTE
ncbi:MAG: ester cyclase [Flammeovirgaceae bacterium]|nr:ester cyclase [Flammeovirgaceae bacterium]